MSSSSAPLVDSALDLPLLSRGKVRDIYVVPGRDDALLFVASDRISAYDVVLANVRPAAARVATRDR
jgi:phosphoribosylaminoimidazole-succinocarboxamide synthase